MADLIQKTDTLNDGREKLNEAIKDADTAKVDASTAKSTANQALAKSTDTQTQLDTIVIEGDSSVEAAQARVDAKGKPHTTLKARLDSEQSEVTSQLAEKAKKNWVDVTDFGAKGDGVTDDTAAIKSAITSLTGTKNKTLLYPSATGFLTSDTIKIPNNINVKMEAPILYNGPNNKPCIEVGTKGSYTNYRDLILWAENKNQSNWSDYSLTKTDNTINVGIKLINIAMSKVRVIRSVGFTVGVECLGADSFGFYFNELYLGELRSNKYGVEIVSENAGWPNGNNFYNGSFAISGGVNANIDRGYIKQTTRTGTYSTNANKFFNMQFEGGVPTAPADMTPIILDQGSRFSFKGIRAERCTSTYFARFGDVADNNNIELDTIISSSSAILDSTDRIKFNYLIVTSDLYKKISDTSKYLVFDSGLMKDKMYTVTDKVGFTNMLLYGNSTLEAKYMSNTFPPSIVGDYVKSGAYAKPGVVIDTSLSKKFVIEADITDAYSPQGRFQFVLFDQNGVDITDVSKIKNISVFKSQYYLQENVYDPSKYRYFSVDPSVYSMAVIAYGHVKYFKIYSLDNTSKVLKPVNVVTKDVKLLSPSGKRFILTVDDNGLTKTTEITTTNEL